jgi:hypothetical protein
MSLQAIQNDLMETLVCIWIFRKKNSKILSWCMHDSISAFIVMVVYVAAD